MLIAIAFADKLKQCGKRTKAAAALAAWRREVKSSISFSSEVHFLSRDARQFRNKSHTVEGCIAPHYCKHVYAPSIQQGTVSLLL